MSFTVRQPGPLTTVQDLGRPGYAHIGVPGSGAADRGALRLANRLLGNAEGAAALEITVGGFEAQSDADAWIVLTGAWCPLTVGGRPVDPFEPAPVRAGETIRVDAAESGLRAYLAIRGGIDVAPVLGSRSRDVLSELGPEALRAGDVLPVGDRPRHPIPVLEIAPWGPPPVDLVELPVALGPRDRWFTDAALGRLFTERWRVSGESNRVGARLLGATLDRRSEAELPSEGMVAGAIQVPPSGLPTILMRDHPVTGGYPVIGVVVSEGIDALAQLRPGQEVAFRHA